MRLFQAVGLVVAACSTILSCSKTNVSGVYLAHSSGAVTMLQLVETADEHLTGKLTSVALDESGNVGDTSYSILGVAHDGNVQLEVRPISFLPAMVTLSGTLKGSTLTLYGDVAKGQLLTGQFSEGSIDDFQSYTTQLRTKASTIATRHAAAAARIQATNDQLKLGEDMIRAQAEVARIGARIDDHIPRLAAAEGRYRAITEKLQMMLSSEQSISADDTFRRGQVEFEIDMATGGTGPTEQLHDDTQSLQSNFSSAASRLGAALDLLQRRCAASRVPACANVSQLKATNDAQDMKMLRAIAEIDRVYADEKAKQNAIAMEAKQAAGK